MPVWNVIFVAEFDKWFQEQEKDARLEMAAVIDLLRQEGPALRRPRIGQIRDSALKNLKEVIVQIHGEPWRLLFIFDPKRNAVFLIGSSKKGNERWYKENIRIAEKRYLRYLEIGQ